MAARASKLEDFGAQKLSKNQQKIVRGGDSPVVPPPTTTPQETDPAKNGGVGTG